MIKYQSEMLGTWKRLREVQRVEEMELAELLRIGSDEVGEVTDLEVWDEFDREFELSLGDKITWAVLVLVSLFWMLEG